MTVDLVDLPLNDERRYPKYGDHTTRGLDGARKSIRVGDATVDVWLSGGTLVLDRAQAEDLAAWLVHAANLTPGAIPEEES